MNKIYSKNLIPKKLKNLRRLENFKDQATKPYKYKKVAKKIRIPQNFKTRSYN
jgi:hypothetical protein